MTLDSLMMKSASDHVTEKLSSCQVTVLRIVASSQGKAHPGRSPDYLMCIPDMALEMMRRWISLVPSKIV
jgi:hypothetical protein